MGEPWETDYAQYLDMGDAREFQDCHTMMNFNEEDEEFLRNLVQKPDGQYSSDLDPVWSELISPSQRDEIENNGANNSSNHMMSPRACVLSFDNSVVNPITTREQEEHNLLKPCSSKRSGAGQNIEVRKNKKRCLEEVDDHIMIERRRRQRISEKFIALSATIPGLKKLDKVTILDEAIKYVKQLQEHVRELEKDPPLTLEKKFEFSGKSNFCEVNEGLPKLDVRVSEKQVFIGIYCEKQKGVEFKILSLLDQFHFSITNISVLPFGKSSLSIIIIVQANGEHKTNLNEMVKSLRQIL